MVVNFPFKASQTKLPSNYPFKASQTNLHSNYPFKASQTNLHSEEVLALVSLEKRPFWRLALQQVGAHGHLTTRDVGTKAFAYTSERQVPTLTGREEHS